MGREFLQVGEEGTPAIAGDTSGFWVVARPLTEWPRFLAFAFSSKAFVFEAWWASPLLQALAILCALCTSFKS